MEPDGAKPNPTEVETIFAAALDLSLTDRERYLNTACGNDQALRRRVMALLEAHRSAEGFLPENSSQKAALPLPPEDDMPLPESEKPGDQIGRYKLLQNIGEGGCGVVYMAEQQEPVRRRVALKVIKLGMDTRQVVARFEAERQALALMEHTNIAKVLDAGATETGRPYFVMELVRGTKITEYCDQNRLPTHERLDLFVQVCRAIEHAHQKGIIHRDIKPSNVLVTLHDGVAVPKVIDFGIAKATQGRLTDHTLFTAFEQFMGTPAYMSPEQAEMSGLDVDTRSDIYSLGVLLYELLTGKTPFDAKELWASGIDAMRHTIRETEPALPSTMLSTMLAGELAAAARQRRIEAPKLISSIQGDLEWIVMKCLDKDRTRRYETASALAADVQRFLKNEPIVARPPSRAYLFQKLVRRHKLLVTSAAAVATALLIGASISTVLWLQEREARRVAVRERARADRALQVAKTSQATADINAKKNQQLAQFLSWVLNGVGPSVAKGRDPTIMQEILSNAVQRVKHSLGNQPDVKAELLMTIGSVYIQLAAFDRAESALSEALTLRTNFFSANHVEVARSRSLLSDALFQDGKTTDAEKMQKLALREREQFLGTNHVEVAQSLDKLGQIVAAEGRAGEAEGLFRRALQIRQSQLSKDSPEVAESLRDVADSISNSGEWEQAELLYREALSIDRKQLPPNPFVVAKVLHSLADLLLSHGHRAEAEDAAREALQIRSLILSADHPLIAETKATLAAVLNDENKPAEAEKEAMEALALQKEHLDSQHPGLAKTLKLLTAILLKQHREADLDRIFNNIPVKRGARGEQTAEIIDARANFHARVKRWAEAKTDYSILVRDYSPNHYFYHSLAALLVQLNDIAGYRELRTRIENEFGSITNDASLADRMAKDCLIVPLPDTDRTVDTKLADVAVTLGAGQPGEAWFRFCKGLAEFRQDHFSDAVEWMQKAIAPDPKHPYRAVEAYMVIAMADYHMGQTDAAREALEKGLELSRKRPSDFSDNEHGWIDWIFGEALEREAKAVLTEPRSNTGLP